MKSMDISELPKHFDTQAAESSWQGRWRELGVYRYAEAAAGQERFAIDTPPPTVSGSLHVGHVFSYTQTDLIARFERMHGKSVFYPMGWDDNGLPTERRVQNYFHVRCNPGLKYEPELSSGPGKHRSKVAAAADLPAQFHRALPAPDPGRRKELQGTVGPVGIVSGLDAGVLDNRPAVPKGGAAQLSRIVEQGAHLQRGSANHVGRGLPDRRGAG